MTRRRSRTLDATFAASILRLAGTAADVTAVAALAAGMFVMSALSAQ
jgi:hypothetical protein